MSETLYKLSPHRDLQVYFERPSAIAAISNSASDGFTVSGTWRQQFDWAVVEWNRHNVIEPHFMRYLPDGDLSGLTLTYEETRENCIPIDSDLYPTVDWHVLRIWTREGSSEDFFKVALKPLAVPIEGSYVCPTLTLELGGTVTVGDYVGVSLLNEHYTHAVQAGDSIESIVAALALIVNTFSSYAVASAASNSLTLTYHGAGSTVETSTVGANGNRVGAYGFVSGARTEVWTVGSGTFSGGTSPTKWRVTIPFGNLTALDGRPVPTHIVRKLRWTYAAELQAGAFQRSEFAAVISNWAVTGTGRAYTVSGAQGQRLEDDEPSWTFGGTWITSIGNFSGGTIRFSIAAGASATIPYRAGESHELAVGTRYAYNAATCQVWLDGNLVHSENLAMAGEDQLCRIVLGPFPAGAHEVELRHAGPEGAYLYLDFLEVLSRRSIVDSFPVDSTINLATDWDTDHSLAIPAERTAWLIHHLGFHGRVNHYVGALWFYEMVRPGHVYASATVDFVGTPAFSEVTTITVGRDGYPTSSDLVASHLNRIGDTAESIAKAFELEFNRGYTAIRAQAVGASLVLYSRTMGADGNSLRISSSPTSGGFQTICSGDHFAGGVDGQWRTDLASLPRINRACRDWSRAFYRSMKEYGCEITAAFSLELQHGDDTLVAGIAQRYPNGQAVWLNTPALQTNFSPESLAYWKDVHLGMAEIMQSEGIAPYLQFGEVQWWYFPLAGIGMTFYDEYSKSQFQAQYGRQMATIMSHLDDPAPYAQELSFLSGLIGQFTDAIMTYVRATYPQAKFEVLYPTDVNDTALNGIVNYPSASWTPIALECLKTESFTYTFIKNTNLARVTVEYGMARGFPPSKRAFLCGIGDSRSFWKGEVALAKSQQLESVTLFALDQYCLIGYPTPLPLSAGRCSLS